eukprot:gene10734-16529_t
MQFYLASQNAEESLMKAVFTAVNDAERAREKEYTAALRIGGGWRGYKQRKEEQRLLCAAVEIQRVYRGFTARARAGRARREAAMRDQRAIFDHMACAIQRRFRGFYVRKWVADHISRKRYLREVEAKSEEIRRLCTDTQAQQLLESRTREQDDYVDSFTKISSKMLYIASTASIPGVLSGKTINPLLHSTFGETAEGALRMHRKHYPKPVAPSKALSATMMTATGVPIVDKRP